MRRSTWTPTLSRSSAHTCPPFVLDDLAAHSDDQIRGRAMAVYGRVALLLLRHLREARTSVPALKSLLMRIADLLRMIPRRVDRRVVIAYILDVADAERSKVESALADALPDLKEDVVTVADQLRIEGERAMFLRVLAARFGARITPEIETRVRSADKPNLDLWLSRVFTATTIEAVFKP